MRLFPSAMLPNPQTENVTPDLAQITRELQKQANLKHYCRCHAYFLMVVSGWSFAGARK